MTCKKCGAALLKTKHGKLCVECGSLEGGSAPAQIISHDTLMHSEHRVAEPSEPGDGKVDDMTDMTAFSAESNASLGAFTWIQVSVSRFSYYAALFVLVFVLTGTGYNLIWNEHPVARQNCNGTIAETSSGPANAGTSTLPTPTCKPIQK